MRPETRGWGESHTPDQTTPDQTRPDQTRPASVDGVTSHCKWGGVIDHRRPFIRCYYGCRPCSPALQSPRRSGCVSGNAPSLLCWTRLGWLCLKLCQNFVGKTLYRRFDWLRPTLWSFNSNLAAVFCSLLEFLIEKKIKFVLLIWTFPTEFVQLWSGGSVWSSGLERRGGQLHHFKLRTGQTNLNWVQFSELK